MHCSMPMKQQVGMHGCPRLIIEVQDSECGCIGRMEMTVTLDVIVQ